MTTTARPRPPAAATATTLASLAASWLIALQAEHKAPATVRAYDGGVREFIKWHQGQAPGMPVTAACLDRRTGQAFIADTLTAGAAATTARARYSALRRFSAWLAAEGETDTDVLLGMRPPRLPKPAVKGLAASELDALIRACKVPRASGDRWGAFEALRDEAATRLLADTGMRAGELAGLTVADVDLRRRIVTIRRAKGNKHRISAFGPEAARAIDRYLRRARKTHRLAAGPALWLGSQNRGPLGYTGIWKALGKRAAAAGIEGFTPHRLRHTAASAALRAGLSEGDVMQQFGWSSRAIVDHYVHDTAQERAAENFARMFDQRGK